jgi:hypothetical protein
MENLAANVLDAIVDAIPGLRDKAMKLLQRDPSAPKRTNKEAALEGMDTIKILIEQADEAPEIEGYDLVSNIPLNQFSSIAALRDTCDKLLSSLYARALIDAVEVELEAKENG